MEMALCAAPTHRQGTTYTTMRRGPAAPAEATCETASPRESVRRVPAGARQPMTGHPPKS